MPLSLTAEAPAGGETTAILQERDHGRARQDIRRRAQNHV
jgi:hypothetical protein